MTFKKGFIPWNKGINQWEGKKHPMVGKTHKKDARIKISSKVKKAWKNGKFKNRGVRKSKPWNYIDGRSKFLPTQRYGDDWAKIRCLIYLRDNFTCQHCGITMKEHKRALDLHHKIPFLISFDNSLSNLITLCRKCHSKEEMRINQIYKPIKIGGINCAT